MIRKYLIFHSKLLVPLVSLCFLLPILTCDNSNETSNQQKAESVVQTINGTEAFKKIVESAGNRLLMFDLYADWCAPCRVLSPMLEKIAKEHQDKLTVYKINVDNNPEIARMFNVTGIPFVVMMKNMQVVHSLLGVQPKETYVRAINQFAEVSEEPLKDTPNGEIIEGIREIRLSTATNPVSLFVYRGETIKLIIEKVEFPYSVHIPDFNISKEAEVGKDLEVTFKAEKIGVFPVFCNGKCPAGDGANYGQIIVMQYEPPAEANFTELSAKEGKELIEKSDPLILDVRTPNEYYGGHIENAKLIPLQQLEKRFSEIENYKDKNILIYCRSGNRSTVASEILIDNGFKRLYNLRDGILGWEKSGYKMMK